MEHYKETLFGATLERYEQKLKLLNGQDPYKLQANLCSDHPKTLPIIEYPDIVNYCVFTKSAYTFQELKSYKSLDAYNQFTCGYVSRPLLTWESHETENVAVMAKVRHSQSANKAPLQAWIIAKKDGTILAAHCNCMAGLAETCTHVSAILFAIDSAVRLQKSRTVTEEAAYWKVSNLNTNKYSSIKTINFKSAKGLKRELDCTISGIEPKKLQAQKLPSGCEPSQLEIETLFKNLSTAPHKPAILSVIPQYSESYVPRSITTAYPWVSVELRNDIAATMTDEQLDIVCSDLYSSSALHTTKKACEQLELDTREQHKSRLWHRFRAGRITASNMKKVCQTNIDQPAKSTIKTICYPSQVLFKSKATDWGCEHEKTARIAYEDIAKFEHSKLEIRTCGLVVDHAHSYIGATPDGIVECECCGKGVLEIKCPYCVKDSHIHQEIDKIQYLQEIEGEIKLKKSHAHYFQVQTQIFVCGVEYCDFVVWTTKELYIERIEPDLPFWNECLSKCQVLFQKAILPELVGAIQSRPNPRDSEIDANGQNSENCVKTPDFVNPNLQECDASLSMTSQNSVVMNGDSIEKSECVASLSASAVDEEVVSDSDTISVGSAELNNDERVLYCICQSEDDKGELMIGCDNYFGCKYQWFHYSCVKIKKAPKGSWYCPTCRELPV